MLLKTIVMWPSFSEYEASMTLAFCEYDPHFAASMMRILFILRKIAAAQYEIRFIVWFIFRKIAAAQLLLNMN